MWKPLQLPPCLSLSLLPMQGAGGGGRGLPAMSAFTDRKQLVEDVAHFTAVSQEDVSVYVFFLHPMLSWFDFTPIWRLFFLMTIKK